MLVAFPGNDRSADEESIDYISGNNKSGKNKSVESISGNNKSGKDNSIYGISGKNKSGDNKYKEDQYGSGRIISFGKRSDIINEISAGGYKLSTGEFKLNAGGYKLSAGEKNIAAEGKNITADEYKLGTGEIIISADERIITEFHSDSVLTPALVNAHTHLQYTGMSPVGKSRYKGMDDWAVAFNSLYKSYSEEVALDKSHTEEVAEAAYDKSNSKESESEKSNAREAAFDKSRQEKPESDKWGEWAAEGARMLLESGTAAVADIITDPSARASLHGSGLKGISFYEVMNVTEEDWLGGYEEQLKKDLMSIPRPPQVGISPHTPFSVDLLPLEKISDMALIEKIRLHIHVGEIAMEAALDSPSDIGTSGSGFRTKDFRNMRLSGEGKSACKLLADIGFFENECHIAHGIYMNAEDRETLRKNNISVALCPRSNSVIGLDEAPVAAYLKEGNQISVGTDSLASVTSLNLLEDTAELAAIAKKQSYSKKDLFEKLFRAATMGGAEALGLNSGPGRIALIEEGAAADFACFDMPFSADIRDDELYEYLVCSIPKTTTTIIDGHIRYSCL